MTCQDPLLSSASVEGWAALDHIFITSTLVDSFTHHGIIFQQMINTRHLPIVGVISCQYSEHLSPSKEDKLDYSCTKECYAAVEKELLFFADNQFPDISSSQRPQQI